MGFALLGNPAPQAKCTECNLWCDSPIISQSAARVWESGSLSGVRGMGDVIHTILSPEGTRRGSRVSLRVAGLQPGTKELGFGCSVKVRPWQRSQRDEASPHTACSHW